MQRSRQSLPPSADTAPWIVLCISSASRLILSFACHFRYQDPLACPQLAHTHADSDNCQSPPPPTSFEACFKAMCTCRASSRASSKLRSRELITTLWYWHHQEGSARMNQARILSCMVPRVCGTVRAFSTDRRLFRQFHDLIVTPSYLFLQPSKVLFVLFRDRQHLFCESSCHTQA